MTSKLLNLVKDKENIGFETKESLQLFSKLLKQNITILSLFFLSFLPCTFTFGA
jgi:hypothetical protein